MKQNSSQEWKQVEPIIRSLAANGKRTAWAGRECARTFSCGGIARRCFGRASRARKRSFGYHSGISAIAHRSVDGTQESRCREIPRSGDAVGKHTPAKRVQIVANH